METQIQEGQDHNQVNREATDPNRGVSKKERRRIEVLEHKLEPRIAKLESQIQEQLARIGDDSDNLRREEHPSRGSFYPASPGNETSMEDGNLGGGDHEGQTNKIADVETKQDEVKPESLISKLSNSLHAAGLGDDPTALRLLADLAALNPLRRESTDALENGNEEAHSPLASKARASHVIQPSGGGIPPAPDLRAEYEKRVNDLRPGDIDGLMEVKREFRRKGMEVW